MNSTVLVILFLSVFVLLALLPFIHRAWTTRDGQGEPDTEVARPTPPDSVDGPGSVLVAEETVSEPEPEPVVAPASVKPSFRDRLGKARASMSGYVGSVLSRKIDSDSWDEIEEALILADVGVEATMNVVDRLRVTAKEEKITEGPQLIEALKAQMKADLVADRSLDMGSEGTTVWLFVGVNGVGKTTTIGKVGKRLTDEGKTVIMAAGDTFRAAAAEQLATWAQRCGADLVRGDEGADPSSVIFDGVQAGAARGVDVVLADTAGRLQNKVNLMEELAKVRRVAGRDPGEVREVLLVIDATTGQNGLSQAKQFAESVDVTGVVLTKLDGSAKGGIVFAIQQEMDLPVKLVGLGESAEDLVDFDPDEFVDALVSVD